MTTANKITVFRMVLVPVFMALLAMECFYEPLWGRIAALAIFVIASVTDSIDGHIARKYNQITNFGKFADPLADKLLVCSALIGMQFLDYINPWAVFIILAREFIITGFRAVAVEEGKVIAAGMSGKIKTCVQIVAICLLLLQRILEEISYCQAYIGTVGIIAQITVWAAVFMTIYSGAEYLILNRDVFKSK